MITEYAELWSYTLVHHSADHDCWYVTAYDENHNQVGDSETDYRKVDAVDLARAYLSSDRCDAVHIFTKAGGHTQTIGGAK